MYVRMCVCMYVWMSVLAFLSCFCFIDVLFVGAAKQDSLLRAATSGAPDPYP